MTGPGVTPNKAVPTGPYVFPANVPSLAQFAARSQTDWKRQINATVAGPFAPLVGLCELLLQLPIFSSLAAMGAASPYAASAGAGNTGNMLSGVQTLADFFIGGTPGSTTAFNLQSWLTDLLGLLGNPTGLGTGNAVAGANLPLLGGLLKLLGLPNLNQLGSSLFGLLPAALDNLDGSATSLPLANILANNDGTASFTNQGTNFVNTLIDNVDGTAMSIAKILSNLLGGLGAQQSKVGAVASVTTQPQAVATATAAVATQTSLTRTTGATTSSGTADIDTFNRSGTLGSPWVATNTGSGAVATNGNDAYWMTSGTGAATEFDRFTRTVAMTDYHTVTVVLDAPVVAAGAAQRLIGRCDAAQANYVYCQWNGTTMGLYKVVSGVTTQLGSSVAYSPHAGDTISLQLGTGNSVYEFIVSVNAAPLIDLVESSPTSVYGVNNRYGALYWSVGAATGGTPAPPQFQMTFANYPNGSLAGKTADTGQAITTSYYPSTNAQPTVANGEYTHNTISSSWEASYVTVPVTNASWMRGVFRVAPGGNNTNGVAMIFWNENFPEGNIGSHDPAMAASMHLAFTGTQFFIQEVNVGFSVTTLYQGSYPALAPGIYTITAFYNTANILTTWGPDLTNGAPTQRTFGPNAAFQTYPRNNVTFEIQEDNANGNFFFRQIQADPGYYTPTAVTGPALPGPLHSFSIADNTANSTTAKFSDNFTRPNSSTLGANWIEEIPGQALQIGGGGPGNLAAPQNPSMWALAVYNTSLQTDQETTSVTIGSSNFSLTNGDQIALLLRSSNTRQIYGVASSGATWQIYTSTSGYSAFQTGTQVSRAASSGTFTLAKGDTLTFTAQGSTYTLLQNGVVRVQWVDSGTVYTYGAGQRQAGVAFNGAVTDGLSAWSASDI